MIDKKISETLKFGSFLSIILVVLIHSSNIHLIESDKTSLAYQVTFFLQHIISMKIALSAVPFFFTVSGYLYYHNYVNGSYFPKIKNRIRTLLLPYLFWSSFVVLMFFVMQSIPILKQFFTNNIIEDMSFYEILNSIFINPINYPLWFLRDLIILVLFSHVIYFLVNRYAYLLLIVTFILWLNNICPGTQLCFYKSESFFFFILGATLSLNKINYDVFINNKFIFSLMMIAYLYFVIDPEIKNLYFFQFSVAFGVYVLWIVSKIMLKYNLAKSILGYSFIIYVFQEPGLTVLKKILFNIFGNNAYASLFIYIVSPMIMIVFLIFFGKILKIYLPNFSRVITGNRL